MTDFAEYQNHFENEADYLNWLNVVTREAPYRRIPQLPTELEIRLRCREIQQGWTAMEEWQRRGRPPTGWIPPGALAVGKCHWKPRETEAADCVLTSAE